MRRYLLLAFALVIFSSGCSSTPYYKKKKLGLRIMQQDQNSLENTFRNKVYASRESSGGKPGNAAGGGCGCN